MGGRRRWLKNARNRAKEAWEEGSRRHLRHIQEFQAAATKMFDAIEAGTCPDTIEARGAFMREALKTSDIPIVTPPAVCVIEDSPRDVVRDITVHRLLASQDQQLVCVDHGVPYSDRTVVAAYIPEHHDINNLSQKDAP